VEKIKGAGRRMQLIAGLAAALALQACGGGSSTPPVEQPPPPVGVEVKSGKLEGGLQGIEYSTATQSGVTGSDGEFKFVEGETVSFKLGNLALGEAKAKVTITPNEMVGEPADELGIETSKLALLLANLDVDENAANGISITSSAMPQLRALPAGSSLRNVHYEALYDFIPLLLARRDALLKGEDDLIARWLELIARLFPPRGDVKLKLVGLNDFHGHISEADSGTLTVPDPADATKTVRVNAGGAAFMATKVRELRQQNRNTVVVSAGDLIGATPLVSALFRDEPTIEAMNLIGLDIAGVGNHEFDKGLKELKRHAMGGCADPGGDPNLSTCAGPTKKYAGAKFPILAANVVDERTNQPVFRPFTVRMYGGIPVGFIGLTLKGTPTIVVPSGVAGLKFLDEAETINQYTALLERIGVKAIVVLIHEGGITDTPFDKACTNARGPVFDIVDKLAAGVDVVISGHTHQIYNCVRNGKIVTSAGSNGRMVTEIDLTLERATRDIAKPDANNRIIANKLNTDAAIIAKFPPLAENAEVAALVKHYADLAAPKINQPVGKITATIDRVAGTGGDHAAGRLIADAQLAATSPAGFGDAVVALMNPGGVRADFVFVAPEGNITFGDAFRVQPFGNSLVTMTLTGQQIKDLLEQQWTGVNASRARILIPSKSFSYSWSNSAAGGSKVDAASMRINGQPVSLVQNYRITVNSFLAEGGDGFTLLTSGTNRLGGAQDIDALIDFFKKNSPIAPDTVARITRTD
jgi:5'-nucleotidase